MTARIPPTLGVSPAHDLSAPLCPLSSEPAATMIDDVSAVARFSFNQQDAAAANDSVQGQDKSAQRSLKQRDLTVQRGLRQRHPNEASGAVPTYRSLPSSTVPTPMETQTPPRRSNLTYMASLVVKAFALVSIAEVSESGSEDTENKND